MVLLALAVLLMIAAFALPEVGTSASTEPEHIVPMRSIKQVGGDGRFVATLTDHECLLFDLSNDGVAPLWLKVDNEWISAIAGSPTRPHVLLCTSNSEASLIDVTDGATLWQTAVNAALPLSASFSRDGSSIALGTENGELLVLDAATGRETLRVAGNVDMADVAFSNDNRLVIAADSCHSVAAWDARTGRLVQRFLDADIHVNSIACSPDGESVALATSSGSTIVWSLATGREIARLDDAKLPALATVYTADGRRLLRGTTWGTIHESDPTGSLSREWKAHEAAVREILFVGDRLLTAGHDGRLRLWNKDRTSSHELLQRQALQ